jgi:hypothetical protein
VLIDKEKAVWQREHSEKTKHLLARMKGVR